MKRVGPIPVVTVCAVLVAGSIQAADVRVKTRDELASALREAKAGTTILIEPGTYPGGLSEGDLFGTPTQPIVIRGADPKQPPVIEGGSSGLHLSSAQHLELRDLIIRSARGNGLNLDDGGKTDSAHDIVLKNLVVQDVGPEGNRDGIKLSGLDRFRVEGCQVSQWGSGGSAIDMVGCHDGEITGSRFENARGHEAK